MDLQILKEMNNTTNPIECIYQANLTLTPVDRTLKVVEGYYEFVLEIANYLGILFNFLVIILLYISKLNNNIYVLIKLKSISIIARSVFESLNFYFNLVQNQNFSIHKAYFEILFSFIKQSSTSVTFLTELLITYDRLYQIKNHTNWFTKIRGRWLYIAVTLVSLSSQAYIFFLKKVEMNCSFDYIVIEMDITKNQIMGYYLLSALVSFSIGILVYLITVFRFLRCYKKYNRNRLRMIHSTTRMSHKQQRLTRIILTMTLIYLFIYLSLLISGILREVDMGSEPVNVLVRFITRKIFYFLERYSSFIFPLLLIIGDKNINNKLKSIFAYER